jgi:hypothetical protein
MKFSCQTRLNGGKKNGAGLKKPCIYVLLLAAARGPLAAYEATPYFNASLMSGQYFYETNAGALSGNASILAASSMKFSPEFTLMPLYSGRYQGAKQVVDLSGGGTLFQALMDHKVSVKGIYTLSPLFRLKPELGIKREYLKETRDEAWGKGLFDYIRPNFSLEGEYRYSDPFTLRAGYDLYRIRFYNYTSLESQIGAADGSLARETAGSHTLDSMNNSFYLAGNGKLPWNSLGDATVSFTMRDYGDQNIVDEAGQLKGKVRKDMVLSADVGWRRPGKLKSGKMLTPGLTLSYSRTDSNQNSYDAQNIKFIRDYYDYARARAGLNISLVTPLSGEKRFWEARLGLGWARTDYTKRPVQDVTGLYETAKIHVDEQAATANLSYDIVKNFKLNASLQYGRQNSNMKYEKLYKYDFAIFSYLMGVSYEY